MATGLDILSVGQLGGGGGLECPSVGKNELGKIELGSHLIWEKEDPYEGYKPRVIIFIIKTTKANQVVNLGYNLGRWENTDEAAKEIPHCGTVNWDDGSDEYTFTGNEGTSTSSKLCHTYGKASEYRITIKGVIKWNKVSTSTSSTSTPNSIREVLKKIEIPENKTSPIYFIDTYAFYYCENLESIPGNLFENCTEVTSFSYCFYITKITAIPEGLFAKCTKATSFSYCFSSTQITAIPPGLFDKCTQATNFTHCFSSTQITAIPPGLFDQCIQVTSFSSCFYITKITAIPEGLFAKCTQATSFVQCFYYTQITAIPPGLFDQCTQATSFADCFGNTKIITIPEGLFAKCTQATSFSYCFGNTKITAIPSGLFANNNKVNNFTRTFYNCTLVEDNLPALWNTHSTAKNHGGCFYNCTKATNYATAQKVGWA